MTQTKKQIIDLGSHITVGGHLGVRETNSHFIDGKGKKHAVSFSIDPVLVPMNGIVVEIHPKKEGSLLPDQELSVVLEPCGPTTEPTKFKLSNVQAIISLDGLPLSNEQLLTHSNPYIRKVALSRVKSQSSQAVTSNIESQPANQEASSGSEASR